MQECVETRKRHKNNQAKAKQQRASMTKDYRIQLKVSSYFDSTYLCKSGITQLIHNIILLYRITVNTQRITALRVKGSVLRLQSWGNNCKSIKIALMCN